MVDMVVDLVRQVNAPYSYNDFAIFDVIFHGILLPLALIMENKKNIYDTNGE